MNPAAVITGVGSINAAFSGGAEALGAWLARPGSAVRRSSRLGVVAAEVDLALPGRFVGESEARRLTRICQLAVAAGRVALEDAGLGAGADLSLVLGTEFGDLHSTMAFADGYLASGPSGLSALLFPNTVINAMAAATAIAVTAHGPSLTLNARTVAGELAVIRAAGMIAGGRVSAVLAGGVDEINPRVSEVLADLGADAEVRGEGATFVVLESPEAARSRGARVRGEIVGVASRTLPARPHGVGRDGASRAIPIALAAAGLDARAPGWVYASLGGDPARDAWQARVLDEALAPHRPPRASLRPWLGEHAGVDVLSVAAAAWTARSGRLPADDGEPARRVPGGQGLVHGLARGGTEVAMVVR